MSTLAIPSRSTAVPGRALAILVALAAGLITAFVVAPPRLAAAGGDGDLADPGRLVAALRAAVMEYWRLGDRAYPPALQRVVDYWFRFHLVKGGIAALLLIVLAALTVRLWRMYLRADRLGRGRRAALGLVGWAVPALGLVALAAVIANLQGALTPFASLFPMLVAGAPDPDLAATLTQAREQLAGSHRTSGYTPAALDAMVDDFGRYHAVLVVIAAVVVVALVGLGVMFWRGFVRVGPADRRSRRILGWAGVGSVVFSLLMAVILVANAGTAADPAPALLALFNGSF